MKVCHIGIQVCFPLGMEGICIDSCADIVQLHFSCITDIDAVDFDYCLNVKKHKYEIVQMNSAELIHHLGKIEKHIVFGKNIFN